MSGPLTSRPYRRVQTLEELTPYEVKRYLAELRHAAKAGSWTRFVSVSHRLRQTPRIGERAVPPRLFSYVLHRSAADRWCVPGSRIGRPLRAAAAARKDHQPKTH